MKLGVVHTVYILVCAKDGSHRMAVVERERRRASRAFRKAGWVDGDRGWICPKCARQPKACEICGKLFRPKTVQKFCGPECVREQHRRRKRSPECKAQRRKYERTVKGLIVKRRWRNKKYREDPQWRQKFLDQQRKSLAKKALDPEWRDYRRRRFKEWTARTKLAELKRIGQKLEAKL